MLLSLSHRMFRCASFRLVVGTTVLLLGLLALSCNQTARTTDSTATNQPTSTSSAKAQAQPRLMASAATTAPFVNGVMLEGFYWNTPITTPNGSWWATLQAQAPEIAQAGITAVWLPPPYKGAGGQQDVGYGVYDRYDLGEFNQKGAVATRYGTLAELQSAIAAFHQQHVQVYADIVMNHMMGADLQDNFQYNGQQFTTWTHFTFPGRGQTYSNYGWQFFNFNGWQKDANTWLQWNPWDFQPYANGDAYDNLMGCEIRYADANNCNELIKWGQWITSKLQLDGYRLDATPHILTSFINQWLDQVKGNRFAVSEAWMAHIEDMQAYAQATGGRTSLFDFPLHNLFAQVLNSSGDIRQLRFAGFTEVNGPLSVSFVDNHDTDQGNSPVIKDKILAYAYILMRDKGYPCIFYKDYYVYGLSQQIKQLIQLRQAHAYGASKEYNEDDPNVYIYSRAGDGAHTGLLLILDDNAGETKQITTPWPKAVLRDATGNQPATIGTDANGVGVFPVSGHSYGVWVVR